MYIILVKINYDLTGKSLDQALGFATHIPGILTKGEALIMLDPTLFSHQSVLYVATHGVRDGSPGLFTLISGYLGAVCGLRAPVL